MEVTENLILNKKQLHQKIRRIAHQIAERNFKEKKLVIAGIPTTGFEIAKILVRELKKIRSNEIVLAKIDIDKANPAKSEVRVDIDSNSLKNACLIIVDDVLNTGRTFVYSMKPFLDVDLKKIETVAMVNRAHRFFPVTADYTGYEMATTLKDHVKVVISKEDTGVYLL
jgi:pyrimidine operon attenuation protein/uracil phosphoribosyltransferase